jgi:hypothetical protein
MVNTMTAGAARVVFGDAPEIVARAFAGGVVACPIGRERTTAASPGQAFA